MRSHIDITRTCFSILCVLCVYCVVVYVPVHSIGSKGQLSLWPGCMQMKAALGPRDWSLWERGNLFGGGVGVSLGAPDSVGFRDQESNPDIILAFIKA